MNRWVLAGVLLCIGSVAQAQVADEQAQKMQEGLMAMQACMSKLDPEAIESMKVEGQKLEARFESLCKAGDEKAAKKFMLKEGREFSKLPVLLEMKACMKVAIDAGLPGMGVDSAFDFEQYEKDDNVCD